MWRLCCLLGVISIQVCLSEAASCSSHADCPQDQCCGKPSFDVLGLVQSCVAMSKEGESCGGDLLFQNCLCEQGFHCNHHSGLGHLLHTSAGRCEKDGTFSASIFG